jgi:hypothetical protein
MSYMANVATRTTALLEAPRLRLLPQASSNTLRTERRNSCERPTLRPLRKGDEGGERPVLLAGGDAAARAAVQSDLAKTMPADTTFEQAGAVWEVLVRAPSSSMVILSGELEDIAAGSVMQMITHRHPEVPVVCMDAAAA